MNRKTITIQTNTIKKGKPDQRSFACQTIELAPRRIYVLEETKNDLTRKRFTVTPGCKIIDDGDSYTIEDIKYWKKPMYPFLLSSRNPRHLNPIYKGEIRMEKKTVTIQTNTPKKGRLDQRSFTCQVYEDKDQRVYILDDTKRDLTLKRFNLTKGCRVIEDGITYFINEVRYSPRPSRPVLIVDPKIII